MHLSNALGSCTRRVRDRALHISSGTDERVYAGLLLVGALLSISNSQQLSIAALAMGMVLSILSPVVAFWACCAAIPFVYHPIFIGSASVTLLEAGLAATMAGIGGRIVVERARFSYSAFIAPKEIRWVWPGAAALIIAGVLAIILQPDQSHVRESVRTFRWVIVEAIVAFVAARYAIGERGEGRVAGALAIPAAGVSLWALAEAAFGLSGFEADGVFRATASYLHPNNLALYLIRVFVLLLAVVVLAGPRGIRFHWLAGAALVGLALAATLSRGALLGALAGMLLIAWYARRRTVLLVSVGMAVSLPVAFMLFAEQRFLGGDSSGIGETRIKIWSSAFEMIRDYPISGIGMDQFLYQHNPRYIDPSAWQERYISHPHNLLLDSWLSLGLPGILLLTAAVIALWRQTVSVRKHSTTGQCWQAAATASLTAGLVHSLVDNGYFLPDLAAMTWILIALSLGPVAGQSRYVLGSQLSAMRQFARPPRL